MNQVINFLNNRSLVAVVTGLFLISLIGRLMRR